MKEFLTWLRFLVLRWPNSKPEEELRFHVQQSTTRNFAFMRFYLQVLIAFP
jgi:hypothetical protein